MASSGNRTFGYLIVVSRCHEIVYQTFKHKQHENVRFVCVADVYGALSSSAAVLDQPCSGNL